MILGFYKMQGCGNDFLFLDYVNSEPPELSKREIVFLCDRHFGIGADGLVILRGSQLADAGWDFYNSDGSQAEMCGNAARCAIRFLSEKYFPNQEPVSLETKAGIIKGRMLTPDQVEITLLPWGNVEFPYEEKVIKVDDNIYTTFCVNTGVPHAVIEVSDIASYPIAKVGKALVGHPAFGSAGSNITFFQREVGAQILSTTFERGVEAETFACGTGAAAAAIVYSERFLQPFPVQVTVPGGELTVDTSPVSKMLLLRGPAEYVVEVEIEHMPANFEQPTLYGERKKKK